MLRLLIGLEMQKSQGVTFFILGITHSDHAHFGLLEIMVKIQKPYIWLMCAYGDTKVGYFDTGIRMEPFILRHNLHRS